MILILVAVIGLLSAGALHDALFGEQLAGSRLLHQRAAALADLGIQDGVALVTAWPSPVPHGHTVRMLPSSGESISVSMRHLGSSELPDGSSTSRLAANHFEIESIGQTGRGIRMIQVQGMTRVMPIIVAAASQPEPGTRPDPDGQP